MAIKEQLIYRIIADTGNSVKDVNDLIARNKELKEVISSSTNLNTSSQHKLQAAYAKNTKALLEFNKTLNGNVVHQKKAN